MIVVRSMVHLAIFFNFRVLMVIRMVIINAYSLLVASVLLRMIIIIIISNYHLCIVV